MPQSFQPLIVGAGPVGLAAALFLAREGVRPRIVDMADAPSVFSKALAVNPRTLELLEPTGVTADMLRLGKPIHGGRFWRHDHIVARIDFSTLPHRYPFLLALSQAVTVRLLETALNQLGITVERNLKLIHCHNDAGHARAELQSTLDGATQIMDCAWLLAADGAHSVARHELGIKFQGSSFDQPWYLLDVPLSTQLAEDAAHIKFLDGGGFLFLLRMVGGHSPSGDPLWRVLGDFPDLLDRLGEKATGPAVWSSHFHISHRMNDRMQVGQVFFAGDAAHIHSPVGARGLNLGIEDAWVFSRLCKTDRLDEYGDLRRKVDRRVVRRIELISRLARGESPLSRALRATVLPLMTKTAVTRDRIIETVTGLDHPLPAV